MNAGAVIFRAAGRTIFLKSELGFAFSSLETPVGRVV